MTQLALDTGSGPQQSLACGLTPSGQIVVRPGLNDGPAVSASVANRITDAFSKGRGHGVLHLGAAELATDIPQ